MNIIYKKLTDLKEYGNNPRRNNAGVDAVAESIRLFGFKVPIVIDGNGVIVAGHTRLKAARKLGLKEVPCVVADDLTAEQVRAFRLADNKVGELARWDRGLLAKELEAIGDEMTMEKLGFDGTLMEDADEGSSGKEIDTGEFGDEAFEYRCPACGFRFNG